MSETNENVSSDIKTLETLNTYVMSDSPTEVVEAKIISPVEKVEDKLADLIQHIYAATKLDIANTDAVWEEVISRLPNLSDAALLNLLNNQYQNQSDRISKEVAPLVQLMTAQQQAIIAEQGRRQAREERSAQTTINIGSNLSSTQMKNQNESVETNVVQGLNDMYQIMLAFKNAKAKEEEKTNEQ